ncbi:6-bladed beta-propeller [Bacteroides sp. OttesenSCG-928-E20]|nr:6-bladed beta-propeller [Bacteroides sp. OttesenSCG-928-N06]MDL2299859.1 6-bladed beta-propeller [Bacteroides sp. OttesenSCG-928-E20]
MRLLCRLSLLSCLFFLSSCIQPKENSSFPVIDWGNYTSTTIQISDYVDSISYIQLDSTVIIPGFSCVHATDSCFFLGTTEGILKYNHCGKFLHKIGNIGQGPGEYTRGQNKFSLDTKKQQIYVYNYPDRIMTFTFDGEYLGQVEIKHSEIDCIPAGFHFINGSFYFFHFFIGGEDQPYLWEVIDADGKRRSFKRDYNTRWTKDEQVLPFHGGFIFYIWQNNSALYWNHVNDTIYRVSEKEQKPVYLWAKNPLRLSKKYVENTKFLSPYRIVETNNYLFIQWFVNWKDRLPNGGFTLDIYNCIYDKSSETLIGTKGDYFTDDINGGCLGGVHHYVVIQGKEYIGTIVLPKKLIDALMKANTPKSRSLATNIDKDGNPILVLMRMRNSTGVHLPM